LIWQAVSECAALFVNEAMVLSTVKNITFAMSAMGRGQRVGELAVNSFLDDLRR
jgi:hypothetical protein